MSCSLATANLRSSYKVDPVREGDIVGFYASNPRVGRTSFTFDLEGRVQGGVVVHTTVTFVALDADGRPAVIPPRG